MYGYSYQVVVSGFCCLDYQIEIVTYDFTLSEREVKPEAILNQHLLQATHIPLTAPFQDLKDCQNSPVPLAQKPFSNNSVVEQQRGQVGGSVARESLTQHFQCLSPAAVEHRKGGSWAPSCSSSLAHVPLWELNNTGRLVLVVCFSWEAGFQKQGRKASLT